MHKKLVLIVSSIVYASALALACGQPQPAFSRNDAIQRARESARQSVPELFILEARIDEVTAELVPLQEVDRRMEVERGAAGYGRGRDQDTPVWWVRVRGYFRFEGMSAPGGKPPVYEAGERIIIYDARTSEELGSRMPYTHPAGVGQGQATTATPAVKLSREQAIEAALEIARSPQVEIGPAQVPPRLILAEITTYAEVQRQEMHIPDDLLAGTGAGERVVWLVTMEGRWENGFPVPTGVPTPEPYPRYMVVLDAMTGEQLMVAARR